MTGAGGASATGGGRFAVKVTSATGAASGIGRATAPAFARGGASVVAPAPSPKAVGTPPEPSSRPPGGHSRSPAT
ncbi:hypothetical protein K7G98_01715 [Saccharothrix sp. MB29]|nr:hypothetical protein [Saccharothrix sp. MB29]